MSVRGSLENAAGGRDTGFTLDRMPLFRPEALAAAAETGFGKPIATLPVSWTILSMLSFLLTAGVVAFLMMGAYTRLETAPGVVRYVNGDVRVAVPTGGVVSRMNVIEGTRVRAGDLLMVVDTRRRTTNGQPIGVGTVRTLDAELGNLSVRLRALNSSADIEQKSFPERMSALRGEQSAAVEQEASAEQRLDLAEQALEKLQPVADRGFISGETMRRRRDEVISLKQSVADARALQARLDGQITELATTGAERPMTLVQERGQLLDLIARTKRDRAEVAGQSGFAVSAPVDGVVTAVQANLGQPVDPQMTLMTIAPQAGHKQAFADLFVPSRAVGFLQKGQRVKIRYDAFPYQRFGIAGGTVTAISSSVLRPSEVTAAVKVEEPVYRIVVALDHNYLTAYGRKYFLRTGLALSGDIILEKQPFYSWLLDPILAIKGRL